MKRFLHLVCAFLLVQSAAFAQSFKFQYQGADVADGATDAYYFYLNFALVFVVNSECHFVNLRFNNLIFSQGKYLSILPYKKFKFNSYFDFFYIFDS